MSKQQSAAPNEPEAGTRAKPRRKRDRPWLLQMRANQSAASWRRTRWREWWTANRYETEALATIVKDKSERAYRADMWEFRVIHEAMLAAKSNRRQG